MSDDRISPFRRFFLNSREAGLIARMDGSVVNMNGAMLELLGKRKESAGTEGEEPENLAFEDPAAKTGFFRDLREKASLTNRRVGLKTAEGTVLWVDIDAYTWKRNGEDEGFMAMIRAGNETVLESQKYIAAINREKADLKNERQNFLSDSTLLMNYLSEDLIRAAQETGEDPLATSRRTVTILFFDIRNSTSIAEKLDGEVFASILSDLFTDVMDLIYGNHGSVNKMLGDGIMATFGSPVTYGGDADNAVRAAILIQEYLATYNDVRPDALTMPISAGIGIATGEVFSGIIGSVRRREYTVLGDAVNVASRLEGYTKEIGRGIVIDDTTFRDLREDYGFEHHSCIGLRGRQEKLEVYALRTQADEAYLPGE